MASEGESDMAKGRMLNVTVATDKRLNALSTESHLLFLMTIPHLDRDGLIAGDAPLLAGRVIPRRMELHPRIAELVAEWAAADLVIIYETPDTQVIFFPGFTKNQKLQYDKEGASQFPPPPGYTRTTNGLEPDKGNPDSRPTLELVQSKAGVGSDLEAVKLKVKANRSLSEGEAESETVAAPSPAWRAFVAVRGVNVNPMDSQSIQELEDLYGSEMVARAINHCNGSKQQPFLSLRYLIATLAGWQRDGRDGPPPTNGNGNGRNGHATNKPDTTISDADSAAENNAELARLEARAARRLAGSGNG